MALDPRQLLSLSWSYWRTVLGAAWCMAEGAGSSTASSVLPTCSSTAMRTRRAWPSSSPWSAPTTRSSPCHLTLVRSLSVGIPGIFLALAPDPRRACTGFVAWSCASLCRRDHRRGRRSVRLLRRPRAGRRVARRRPLHCHVTLLGVGLLLLLRLTRTLPPAVDLVAASAGLGAGRAGTGRGVFRPTTAADGGGRWLSPWSSPRQPVRTGHRGRRRGAEPGRVPGPVAGPGPGAGQPLLCTRRPGAQATSCSPRGRFFPMAFELPPPCNAQDAPFPHIRRDA